MRRCERRIRFGGALLAVAALSGGAVTAARAQDGREGAAALWARSQRDWLPRLGAALERVPGTASTVWEDPGAALRGRITVFPADPRNCRRFRIEVSGAEGALDGAGVRCRDEGGVWLATGEPDRLVPRPASASSAAPAAVDPPDAAVLALQRDLGRLRYYDGPADGMASAALGAASRAFAADEGLPPGTALPALRDRAADAVARIPVDGGCPPMAAEAVTACARVR